jgi:hypothetical protein
VAKSPWRNRIVGYSEEEPDQLLANPSNWRIHPAAQQNALSGVLKEVGLVQNVVANRTTGHLVDGHLRVMLAMRENQPVVPVTWVELSEEEEHLILAALDPLAAMATADAGALDALLSSVQSGEAAVTDKPVHTKKPLTRPERIGRPRSRTLSASQPATSRPRRVVLALAARRSTPA